jgi:RNA polymerase sigma-70 factor (sigma-E family)
VTGIVPVGAKGSDVRSSSEADFREFAASAMPRLRRVALGISRDPHAADDLVQTTMEKLYVAWPKVARATSPYAYARQTLVRSLLAERRRLSWGREVVADDVDGGSVDPGEATDARLVVHDALAALTARQRACVVLRHLEGLSVAETARAIGCSEGTVKSTTSDALARMRTHLDDPAPRAAERSAS